MLMQGTEMNWQSKVKGIQFNGSELERFYLPPHPS